MKGLKVYVDTDHNLATWEEIDSVTLSGDTVAIPEPSTAVLLGVGLLGLAARRRRRE